MEETDAQLQLKKRARRRLVGAVAFATLVAVVLPMIMDHEPRQAVQDVEIRIPGQDEKPFAPKFATAPAAKPEKAPEKSPEKPAEAAPETPRAAPAEALAKPAAARTARVVELPADKPAAKPQDKPAEKPAAKPEKPAAKPADKAVEKPAEKPAEKAAEAKRASAILGGQPAEAPAAKAGEHIILIGAFTNEGNVAQLKTKLAEQGIKVFTEPLDTPQGKKTRVRAGPFPSREAADKALEKMKRIGVSGVVTAKQ